MQESVIQMQQEAERRVRQMRERSRILVSGDLPGNERNAASIAANRPPARTAPPAQAASPPAGMAAKSDEGGLSHFPLDRDQMFLLLLAFLLIKNGASTEIIVALLYLAM